MPDSYPDNAGGDSQTVVLPARFRRPVVSLHTPGFHPEIAPELSVCRLLLPVFVVSLRYSSQNGGSSTAFPGQYNGTGCSSPRFPLDL